MKSINKIHLFYILIASISLFSAGIFYLSGGKYDSSAGIVLAIFYMFIPTIATLIIEKGIHKEKNIKDKLLISFKLNKWFLVAWLIAPIMAFATIGVSLLLFDVTYSPGMEGMLERFETILTQEEMQEIKESLDEMPINPLFIMLFQGLIAGITVNAIAGFGEELGWRGFLVRQFEKQKFLKVALIIGFVWGIWHSPIILMGHNYPEYPVLGVFMMTAWCILLSPLFLYITLKAKSVIAAAILHGTLNATAGLSIITLQGGSELTIGLTGLAGFMTVALFTLILFLYDKYVTKEQIMTKIITLD